MNSAQPTCGVSRKLALFELGFRPFFLFAAMYSIVATLTWAGIYVLGLPPAARVLSTAAWHAHEMVFGYGAAVAAGFLLTAAQNWTGLRTLHSWPLALLLVLWLVPRLAPYFGEAVPPALSAGFDLAFTAFLIGAVGSVIFRSGNRKQFVILFLLAALLAANGAYYLGMTAANGVLMRKADLSGLFALLALILILAGRVVPFFTERGVGYPVQLRNVSRTDPINLILFALFWISELADAGDAPRVLLSAALFCLNAFRLQGWYTHGIWSRPLIWVLHAGYGFLTAGFLLHLLSILGYLPPQLAVHAFAYGGVGMMTLGMMSRVTLGHTGRSVHRPPAALTLAFGALFAGTLVRVAAPIAAPDLYVHWIALSQLLWVLALAVFLLVLGGALVRPRVDGKPG